MKRIISVLMVSVLLLTLSACGHEHEVSVGVCSTCGEFQNQDLVTSIENKLSEAKSELDVALLYMQNKSANYNTVYNAISDIQTYLNNSKSCLNEAEEMCGEYEELDTTRTAIHTAINKVPSKPLDSSASSIESYLDSLELYILALGEAQLKILYVK